MCLLEYVSHDFEEVKEIVTNKRKRNIDTQVQRQTKRQTDSAISMNENGN